MNVKSFANRHLGLVFLSLAAACSGGDVNIPVEGPSFPPPPPLPSSEPITAHGVLVGLGDVTVNGVRYSADGATITVNGEPGTSADLKIGQIGMVTGKINSGGQSGSAHSVRIDANVIGPVEHLDAPNNQMIVMGQPVMTDLDTAFSAGIDPATFAGVAVGENVQVSGFADAVGAIHATRVEPDTASTELQLIGRVAGLDLANLLFMVNRLIVDYSRAMVIDLPGGAPTNGMMVKAIGTMSGGRLIAERLVTAPALVGNAGRRVQTAGIITRFNSPTDFDIDSAAAAVNAGTIFLNGDAADLALNAELVIDGDFASSGRIRANRVVFGRHVDQTATVEFDLSDFTEISVPTVFNVTVTRSSAFRVEVTIDADAVDRVDVSKTGTRLNIALKPGDSHIETLQAVVAMPVLERIELTGVVNASLNGFQQTEMTVNVGGVSRLRGNALVIDDLTARVSGVSQLDLGDIRPLGGADIDISGVSQATLNMDVGTTLRGSVATGQGTGTSTLFYYGTNVDVNVAIDSKSSVVKLGETRP